jgi:hypothetical protein
MLLMSKRKGISVHKNIMFSNETLTEIPIPTKKPQEIGTKKAHNILVNHSSISS